MMIPAILNTNGIVSLTKTFVASDPMCPAMRVFLDGVDVSKNAMVIHGPIYPGVERAGWVKFWIKPHMVDEQPLLETKVGLVRWEPIEL